MRVGAHVARGLLRPVWWACCRGAKPNQPLGLPATMAPMELGTDVVIASRIWGVSSTRASSSA